MTRRAVLRTFVATGVGAVAGFGAYGYLDERHRLTVLREDVPMLGLPPALAGLRVGFLIDIHRSRWVPHDDVVHAVARLMDERPDLIILGGDYVTDRDRQYMEPSAEALRPLSAAHGVYSILGNHDDDHDMPAALTARGVQVLKDARTRVTIRGEAIDLVGIRYWTKRASDIAAIAHGATGFVILLAHDPRRLTVAAAMKVPLVLSGPRTADRSSCRWRAQWRLRNFLSSPASAAATRRRCS